MFIVRNDTAFAPLAREVIHRANDSFALATSATSGRLASSPSDVRFPILHEVVLVAVLREIAVEIAVGEEVLRGVRARLEEILLRAGELQVMPAHV